MSFQVIVHPSTFQASLSSLAGQIWIESDGHAFPSELWDDFPVTIVRWWIDESLALAEATADSAEFRFMDGPWWVTVTREGDEWTLQMVDGHKAGGVVTTATGRPREVMNALQRAAMTILEACDSIGWLNEDVAALRRSSEQLAIRLKRRQ